MSNVHANSGQSLDFSIYIYETFYDSKQLYFVVETPPPVPEIFPPPQVQGIMLTQSGTSLNVSWTAVTHDHDSSKYKILYVVQYSTKCGTETDPPSDAMKRSGITNTSTMLTGLEPNTTYYVLVAAEILGAGVQGPYSIRVVNRSEEGT